MKVFLFGTGNVAKDVLSKINPLPQSIDIIGIVSNSDSESVWGGYSLYKPSVLKQHNFDLVIVLSDLYYNQIFNQLVYLHEIPEEKIRDKYYLLKCKMQEKYSDSDDQDIRCVLDYWKNNELSDFNCFYEQKRKFWEVKWDYTCDLPFVIFEGKEMYFPTDYEGFEIRDEKMVIYDLDVELDPRSPHYYEGNGGCKHGDVVVDVGCCEGNYALHVIDKVKRIIIVEGDLRWEKPLRKTFEKYKDRVEFIFKYIGPRESSNYTTLNNLLKGKHVDYIKMDIEGNEVDALLTSDEVFRDNNLRCSICCYHRQYDERIIKQILKSYGYESSVSKGYGIFLYGKTWNEDIFSSSDFRRYIVYGKKVIR